MRKAPAIVLLLLLAGLAAPAWARPIDAKTVKLFLAACGKDQDGCYDDISAQVLAESDGELKDQVCLTDDMHDAPIMISRAMMSWLKSARQFAAKPPAQAIEAGAKILYPCNP
jgi:hypothetical protein